MSALTVSLLRPLTSPPISRRVPTLVLALALLAAVAHAQLPAPSAPPENPLTVEKANLGKVLFWDEQVSSTRTVACGTCHLPSLGGEDPQSGVNPLAVHPGPDGEFGPGGTSGGADDIFGSPGVPLNQADGLYDWSPVFGLLLQVTGRKTVSSINAGYDSELFWDGRAADEFVDPVTQEVIIATGGALESQAAAPPVSDVEMAHLGRDWVDVVARIGASVPLALSPDVPEALHAWIDGRGYAELFDEAFGSPGITAARVAMAVASYERTQFTDETPFDEWLETGVGLTPQELAGLTVFSAAQCNSCHVSGPPRFLLSDGTFRYTGVRPQSEDPGRGGVTKLEEDEGKMRVPSLRNVELRAPYMHNGRFGTIEEVIEFYDRGGDFPDEPNLDSNIVPLNLTAQQKADLLAFLTRPLTDPRLADELPPFDRPVLYTESSRVPAIEGSGLPGTGDLVPEVVALEPPLIGNPSFTVAVWNALGGADALLVIDDHDPGIGGVPTSGAFWFEEIDLGGAGEGAGFGSVSIAIPNDPELHEQEWFGRWYVLDTGGGEVAAVSRLFRFRTFRGLQQFTVFADGFESGNTAAWSATVP